MSPYLLNSRVGRIILCCNRIDSSTAPCTALWRSYTEWHRTQSGKVRKTSLSSLFGCQEATPADGFYWHRKSLMAVFTMPWQGPAWSKGDFWFYPLDLAKPAFNGICELPNLPYSTVWLQYTAPQYTSLGALLPCKGPHLRRSGKLQHVSLLVFWQ